VQDVHYSTPPGACPPGGRCLPGTALCDRQSRGHAA